MTYYSFGHEKEGTLICKICGKETERKSGVQIHCVECARKLNNIPKTSIEKLIEQGKLHCDVVCAYFKEEVSGKDDWHEVMDRERARHGLGIKLYHANRPERHPPDKVDSYQKEWRKNNPEKAEKAKAQAKWRKNNPEKLKAQYAYLKEWRKNNPEKAKARDAKYRAAKKPKEPKIRFRRIPITDWEDKGKWRKRDKRRKK